MPTEHILTVKGQPYFNSQQERNLTIYYAEPDQGITASTGILLLISGFEGDTGSKVYKKMRTEFSTSQNLVVIQCDYFGYQFMSSQTMTEVQSKLSNMSKQLNERFTKGLEIEPQIDEYMEQEETPDSFCELGILQALDNLKAVREVIHILDSQNRKFDHNRVLAYGFSHGGYLALLCNSLMPNLFSSIIDNSGWVYPVYLYRPRMCHLIWNSPQDEISSTLFVYVHYQGRQWIDDLDIYNLNRLYAKFENKARIISFHGESDGLVTPAEKMHFLKRVANTKLYLIQEEDIDGNTFKNTKHGMGSNFLNLFYFVTDTEDLERIKKEDDSIPFLFVPRNIQSKKYQYMISENMEIIRKKL